MGSLSAILAPVLTKRIGRSVIETEYDIGLSAGRNRLVEAAQTRMVIFSMTIMCWSADAAE